MSAVVCAERPNLQQFDHVGEAVSRGAICLMVVLHISDDRERHLCSEWLQVRPCLPALPTAIERQAPAGFPIWKKPMQQNKSML